MYDESLARTTHGPVRGRVRDGIHVFRGIRYGADTAPARFLPPRPPAPWTDVANAFVYGPTCPQDDPDTTIPRDENPFLQKIGLTDSLPESENCLFLNVWTPGMRDGARRPVMVWVHSGGYAVNSGSSPAIEGTHLAQDGDAVVVTFNHRLGVLGFTHLSDDPASPFATSGNVGLLDVVEVLVWVRENIAEFGGDPGNVTILGQSGGAMKISTLLAMPAAAGLFHKAILQSGTVTHVLAPEAAARATARLRAELDLPGEDIGALQAVPVQDLMRAHRRAAAGSLISSGPVLDGTVVPAHPFSAEAAALTAGIPMIIGELGTEATLFLAGQADALRAGGRAALVGALAAELGGADAERIVAAVERDHPGADAFELSARVLSGLVFTGPGRVAADGRSAAEAGTWRYRITWRTPVDDGLLLSPHELDVALLFGNVEAAAGLNGGGSEAHALGRALSTAWTRFARTGRPADEEQDWPRYTAEDRATLVLDPLTAIAHDVDGAELEVIAPFITRHPEWLALLS